MAWQRARGGGGGAPGRAGASDFHRALLAALCGALLAVLFAALLGALPGCSGASARPVLRLQPEPGAEPAGLLWPVPPEVPRYRYVGALVGEPNFFTPGADESAGGVAGWLRAAWHWLTGIGSAALRPVVLQRPQSGVTDRQGRIYVTDVSRQAVFAFDAVAGELRLWEYADGRRRFVSPVGLAIDGQGRLLVTDAALGGVYRFSPDGVFQGSFGEGVLERPTGIAVDPEQGHIYVADTDADNVKVFDAQGALLDTLGFAGEERGRLNRPVYLAFARGRLYVSDTLNARVQIFDREGSAVAAIGRRGLYVGNLTRPKGIALDGEGHLYVVEGFYDHLLVYGNDGEFLMSIGGTGQRPGQFYLPTGVWTDGDNRIYVADMFNGRVSVFQFLGAEQ